MIVDLAGQLVCKKFQEGFTTGKARLLKDFADQVIAINKICICGFILRRSLPLNLVEVENI